MYKYEYWICDSSYSEQKLFQVFFNAYFLLYISPIHQYQAQEWQKKVVL